MDTCTVARSRQQDSRASRRHPSKGCADPSTDSPRVFIWTVVSFSLSLCLFFFQFFRHSLVSVSVTTAMSMSIDVLFCYVNLLYVMFCHVVLGDACGVYRVGSFSVLSRHVRFHYVLIQYFMI